MYITKKHQNQNLLILLFQLISWWGCISLINSEIHFGIKIVVLIFFSLMMQRNDLRRFFDMLMCESQR